MKKHTPTAASVVIIVALFAPLLLGVYNAVTAGGSVGIYAFPVLWTVTTGIVLLVGAEMIVRKLGRLWKVALVIPVAEVLAFVVLTSPTAVTTHSSPVPIPILLNTTGTIGVLLGFGFAGVYVAKDKATTERLFKNAAESATVPIFITDTNGVIEYVNDAFVSHTGYEREEVIGETPEILKSGYHSDAFYENMWETITSGEVWENQTINKRKDGSPVIELQTITPAEKDGEITHFVSINHDITELKRYESELEDRNKKLEMLTHTLRHDVKNDINIITGLTGSVIQQMDDGEIKQQLEDVYAASVHIQEITNSVQTYMKAFDSDTSVETSTVDIVKLVDNVVESRRTAFQNAEIRTTYAHEEILCKGNHALQSVIRNIINNAVQHNDKDTPEVVVSVEETAESVIVRIADNGPGVSDTKKQQLFNKNEKDEDSDGTGIGLWITERIVEAVGGDITVRDSEELGGAVFEIRLQRPV